jgi:hypothetical protein
MKMEKRRMIFFEASFDLGSVTTFPNKRLQSLTLSEIDVVAKEKVEITTINEKAKKLYNKAH